MNIAQKIKTLHDSTGMHPYEADQKLIDRDAEFISNRDSKGNWAGLNIDNYIKGLESLSKKPILNEDRTNDIQMTDLNNEWVTLDLLKAHKLINENSHCVRLRRWKNDQWIALDAYPLNATCLLNNAEEMKNKVVMMPTEGNPNNLSLYTPEMIKAVQDENDKIPIRAREITKEEWYSNRSHDLKAQIREANEFLQKNSLEGER